MKRLASLCLAMLALAAGCQSHPAQSPAPASTSPSTTEFVSKAHGLRLSYPPDWSPAPSDEFVLKLVATSHPDTSISLDVPRLPPHVPGLIPLGMVVNGYIDDLKKQHPGVVTSQPEAMKVAGASARRVRATWDAGSEEAVLTVHGDRVYIFRANSPSAQHAGATDVLNGIVNSVQWK